MLLFAKIDLGKALLIAVLITFVAHLILAAITLMRYVGKPPTNPPALSKRILMVLFGGLPMFMLLIQRDKVNTSRVSKDDLEKANTDKGTDEQS